MHITTFKQEIRKLIEWSTGFGSSFKTDQRRHRKKTISEHEGKDTERNNKQIIHT